MSMISMSPATMRETAPFQKNLNQNVIHVVFCDPAFVPGETLGFRSCDTKHGLAEIAGINTGMDVLRGLSPFGRREIKKDPDIFPPDIKPVGSIEIMAVEVDDRYRRRRDF